MSDKKISALTGATTPLIGTEVLPIVQNGSTVKVANNDLVPKQIQSKATSGVLQIVGPLASTTCVMTTPDVDFTAARIDKGQVFTGTQTITGASGVEALTLTRNNGGTTSAKALILDSVNDAFKNYAGIQFKTGGVNCGQIVQEDTGNIYFDAVSNLYIRPGADVIFTTGNLTQGTAAKGVNFTANAPAAGMTSQLLNWYEEGTWTPTQGSGLIVVGAFTSSGTYTRVGRIVTLSGRVQGATSVAVSAGGIITSAVPWQAASTGTGAAVNSAKNASATTILGGGSFNLYSVQAVTTTTFIDFTVIYRV